MILGMGWTEIAVVAIIALIVIGPDKLPQFARGAGRLYGQVRRAADDMRRALVLEADRQDAAKRYEEMLARQERARQEREAAEEASPGVTAQEEVLPAATDFEAFEADPHGPYGDGSALEAEAAGASGEALPPGVTQEEWDELPEHIRDMLRRRSGASE